MAGQRITRKSKSLCGSRRWHILLPETGDRHVGILRSCLSHTNPALLRRGGRRVPVSQTARCHADGRSSSAQSVEAFWTADQVIPVSGRHETCRFLGPDVIASPHRGIVSRRQRPESVPPQTPGCPTTMGEFGSWAKSSWPRKVGEYVRQNGMAEHSGRCLCTTPEHPGQWPNAVKGAKTPKQETTRSVYTRLSGQLPMVMRPEIPFTIGGRNETNVTGQPENLRILIPQRKNYGRGRQTRLREAKVINDATILDIKLRRTALLGRAEKR